MLYVGNTFDKKVNKGYKTIKNAKKEAEKNCNFLRMCW